MESNVIHSISFLEEWQQALTYKISFYLKLIPWERKGVRENWCDIIVK